VGKGKVFTLPKPASDAMKIMINIRERLLQRWKPQPRLNHAKLGQKRISGFEAR
jgi:hypothetical protein